MTQAAAESAAKQLADLAAVSEGAVQVISGPAPWIEKGWVSFEISLDLAGAEHRANGIRLRDRERFLIAVPPEYPHSVPRVLVSHSRWLGLSHTWDRVLCLYLSPTQEWSPQDGMRGLLTRLVEWLERAAKGALDLPGQPPHPPVAYASPDAGFAVIHADFGSIATPSTTEDSVPQTLIAWGVCRDDERFDVHAWLRPGEFDEQDSAGTLPELPSGQPTAGACIVLNAPIAFTYPSVPATLARGLASAGLTHDNLHTLIRQVVIATSAHTPRGSKKTHDIPRVRIFIGSPSRSIDGETPLVHLLGFTLDVYGQDLDAFLTALSEAQIGDSQDLEQSQQQGRLSWLTVYENRPEITRRRDENSSLAYLEGKRVLVLGCGAIGAPIAEHCTRAGAEITIADHGRVSPGILVRQPYYEADIGKQKAIALAERLRLIRSPSNNVTALTNEIVATLFPRGARAPDYDLVVDATANAGVRSAIEACRSPERAKWPPLVTMLIGHTAEAGIVTVSATNATGGAHDILRRTGLAARQSGARLNDIVDEFFPDPPRSDLFQPEPGCSEPTFTGSASDVDALAANMLNAALRVIDSSTTTELMTSMALRTPNTMMETGSHDPRSGVESIRWENDIVLHEASGTYEVRLSRSAVADIRTEARRRARIHDHPVETGGMLIGSIDDAGGVIYVDHATPPTPDSLLSTVHFEHGTEGAQATVDHHRKLSAEVSGFVGMWHSHPWGTAHPSKTDGEGMASLVVPVGGTGRALMLIIGGEGDAWTDWRDGTAAPVVYAHLIDRTTTTASSAQQPRPPGKYIRAGEPAARDARKNPLRHTRSRVSLARVAALARRFRRPSA